MLENNIFTTLPMCIPDKPVQILIGNALTRCAAGIRPDDICQSNVYIFDLKCVYILHLYQQFRTWRIVDGCPMDICYKLKSSGVENTRRRMEKETYLLTIYFIFITFALYGVILLQNSVKSIYDVIHLSHLYHYIDNDGSLTLKPSDAYMRR